MQLQKPQIAMQGSSRTAQGSDHRPVCVPFERNIPGLGITVVRWDRHLFCSNTDRCYGLRKRVECYEVDKGGIGQKK